MSQARVAYNSSTMFLPSRNQLLIKGRSLSLVHADVWMESMPTIFSGSTSASELPQLRNRTVWSQFVYRCSSTHVHQPCQGLCCAISPTLLCKQFRLHGAPSFWRPELKCFVLHKQNAALCALDGYHIGGLIVLIFSSASSEARPAGVHIMDRLWRRNSCGGGEVRLPIEPLVGLLRHPTTNSDCKRTGKLRFYRSPSNLFAPSSLGSL